MKTILKGNQMIGIYFFLQLLPRDSKSAGEGGRIASMRVLDLKLRNFKIYFPMIFKRNAPYHVPRSLHPTIAWLMTLMKRTEQRPSLNQGWMMYRVGYAYAQAM